MNDARKNERVTINKEFDSFAQFIARRGILPRTRWSESSGAPPPTLGPRPQRDR